MAGFLTRDEIGPESGGGAMRERFRKLRWLWQRRRKEIVRWQVVSAHFS
jgi:hypothetical protein